MYNCVLLLVHVHVILDDSLKYSMKINTRLKEEITSSEDQIVSEKVYLIILYYYL